MNRKSFLKKGLSVAAGSLTGFSGLISAPVQSREGVTILYTNDTHSRIDPFPDNALEFAGLGGVSRRATLVRQIRDSGRQTLLLDAGGVFEGSAWFHMYGGERSFELMSMMGYDAMCPGEHEFSNGVDGLVSAARAADFPFLCANYQTTHAGLSSLLQEYIVRDYEELRIGIFGLGIELEGLIDPGLFEGVTYLDPVDTAAEVVTNLKVEEQCDYVICLSHLGYSYDSDRIDDRKLASRVDGIDLIIGGHTHTFLDEPVQVQTPGGGQTIITQVGHSGIRLGRIDLLPASGRQVQTVSSMNYSIE